MGTLFYVCKIKFSLLKFKSFPFLDLGSFLSTADSSIRENFLNFAKYTNRENFIAIFLRISQFESNAVVVKVRSRIWNVNWLRFTTNEAPKSSVSEIVKQLEILESDSRFSCQNTYERRRRFNVHFLRKLWALFKSWSSCQSSLVCFRKLKTRTELWKAIVNFLWLPGLSKL